MFLGLGSAVCELCSFAFNKECGDVADKTPTTSKTVEYCVVYGLFIYLVVGRNPLIG